MLRIVLYNNSHLPNELALKMDGVQACYSYPTITVMVKREALTSRRVFGADTASGYCYSNLGCQSKYGKCTYRCGKLPNENGEEVKFNCPEGQCCSVMGYCRTIKDYCSLDLKCKSKFGSCWN
ncbi:hypothetical protein BCR36DRAFT_374575 [Piromyces finnis]|uniref:Chitin-binding type-1 domain-containing protein n=1 Tax=Piromyces finnis TaxID=1754191 RepID=A0A1Y1UW62_9FUNG|nr:hypothetical protein BCR36DRAFT_374575 [Piromyces finnis]|eukprot:ORX42338.1 hypothetical protein BCR36DRAFT_374575 [Piromyces finnis]